MVVFFVAHIAVMQTIKPGMYEFHAESAFLHYCYSMGGARLHAYTVRRFCHLLKQNHGSDGRRNDDNQRVWCDVFG